MLLNFKYQIVLVVGLFINVCIAEPYIDVRNITQPQPFNLSDLQPLNKQSLLIKTIGNGDDGYAIMMLDLPAPPEKVWQFILDIDNYCQNIPNMNKSKLIATNKKPNKQEMIGEFSIGKWLVYFNYQLRLVANSNLTQFKGYYLYWHLNPNFTNDFKQLDGFYWVYPHPSKKNWSRIEHFNQVATKSYAPDWVKDILVEDGIEQTRDWLIQRFSTIK